jgi:hypothetical protein
MVLKSLIHLLNLTFFPDSFYLIKKALVIRCLQLIKDILQLENDKTMLVRVKTICSADIQIDRS